MKKNSNSKTCALSLWKKLRIMRYTLFFMMVCLSQIFATNLYSQQTKLNLSMFNSRLGNVLDEIENQSEYYFLFNQQQIDLSRVVNVSVKDKNISDVLNAVFAGTNIHYVISDRQIVLTTGNNTGDFSVNQQKWTVSGKVTESGGQPLPGVTVVVKNTTIGTITDINGIIYLKFQTERNRLSFPLSVCEPLKKVFQAETSLISEWMKNLLALRKL